MDEGIDVGRRVEARHDDDPTTPEPRRWLILSVTLLVGFMSLLDVTIVNVAIPTMREGLDTTAGTIQWVVSGYALTFGLLLVTGGRLGDAYGRRNLMMIGLVGFVVASAAAGLAPTVDVLIAARLFQGISAGLLAPQNTGLIQQLFSGAERGRAFGYFGLTVSISAGAGPILGGAIIALAGEEDGWRWIFGVNVPIGVIALVAIWRLVPGRLDDSPADVRLDVRGAVLLGLTVLCLLYPIVSLESGRVLPLLLVLLVPVLGWWFVRWERGLVARGGAPLLDVGLLRHTTGYASGVFIGALYFTGFTGVLLVVSVYLQDGLDRSALATGLLLTPFAVGSAIAAPWAGRMVSRVGRRITIWSLSATITGFTLAAAFGPLAGGVLGLVLLLTLPLALAGAGGGATVSPNFTLTLAEVPVRMGGAAGGAVQTGQRLGSALGSALILIAYTLASDAGGPDAGLRVAFSIAITFLLGALAIAVWSARNEPVSVT